MPLMKFHIYKGWIDADIERFLDAAHSAMVRTFAVPERDRYQLVTQHSRTTLVAEDTGLGFHRSQRFVLVEVVSRPRSRDEKLSFYENLCADLQQHCGIASTDVMISFVQNTDDDWSFGLGRAQFVTGEL
jgi:hypothetical protein